MSVLLSGRAPKNYELDGRELPPYPLPAVTSIVEIPDYEGVGDAKVWHVDVQDPFLDPAVTSLEIQKSVLRDETYYNNLAANRRAEGLWTRKRRLAYDINGNEVEIGSGDTDPVHGIHTKFIEYVDSPSYRAWLRRFPSAEALQYPSDPHLHRTIKDSNGVELAVDEYFTNFLKACSDGKGIRSRVAIAADIIERYYDGTGHHDLSWTSVACGTALPVFQTSRKLNGSFAPHITLMDYDTNALRVGKELHTFMGCHGDIVTVSENIFNPYVLQQYRADIIDAMGIFEYIGDPVIEMQKKMGIDTSPAKFLKACYDAANKKVIFGQMSPDRPNPDFLMGVLGWPFIEMRSPQEVALIVEEAGIPLEQLNIYTTTDGVYVVYEINKN